MRRRSIELSGLGHGAMPIPLAAEVGGLLMTSGVAGTDPATGSLPERVEDEVAQVFRNLAAILAAAGTDPSTVVKITFYVRDRGFRDAINTEWVAMFPDAHDRPARHTLVYELPGGMRVQADLVAMTTTAAPPGPAAPAGPAALAGPAAVPETRETQ